MPFDVMNLVDAPTVTQARLFNGDMRILQGAAAQNGVISGCAVTPSSGLTVSVAAGVVVVDQVIANVAAGTVTATTAPTGSNNRLDVVRADANGAKSIQAGSVAVDPVMPIVPAGFVALAALFIPASLATITTGHITDKRTPVVSPWVRRFNTQTGAAYTLALSDAGAIVRRSNASANTLTVPPNSSVAFPTGTQIDVAQVGAGQTTIVAGSGVTVNAPFGGTLALAGQFAYAALVKTATDTWDLIGQVA